MAKQIKTVIQSQSCPNGFDEAVNGLLKDGWKLVKREHLPGVVSGSSIIYPALYAELEKEEDRDDA